MIDFESTQIRPEIASGQRAEPESAERLTSSFDGVACRGARAMLGITQTELCALAGCGRTTLNDFEMLSREPRASNVAKIRKALEGLGAEFPDLGDGSVSVRIATRRVVARGASQAREG